MNFLFKQILIIVSFFAAMVMAMESTLFDSKNIHANKKKKSIIQNNRFIVVYPKNNCPEIIDVLDKEPLKKRPWFVLIEEKLSKSIPYLFCRQVQKNSVVYQDAQEHIYTVYGKFEENVTKIHEESHTQYFAINNWRGTSDYIGNSADLLFQCDKQILFTTLTTCFNYKYIGKKSYYKLGKYYFKKDKYSLSELFFSYILENYDLDDIKKAQLWLKFGTINLKNETEKNNSSAKNFAHTILKLNDDIVNELVLQLPIDSNTLNQLFTAKIIDKNTQLQMSKYIEQKGKQKSLTVTTFLSLGYSNKNILPFLREKVSLYRQSIREKISFGSLLEKKIKLVRNAWILLADAYCYDVLASRADRAKALSFYDKARKITNEPAILMTLEDKIKMARRLLL